MSIASRSILFASIVIVSMSRPAHAKPADELPPINVTCAGTMSPMSVHVHGLIKDAGDSAEGSIILDRYEWDFGDPTGRWNSLIGFNAAHVYDTPGNYTITLTVTDPAGHRQKRETKVRVAPDNRKRIFVSSKSGNDAARGLDPASALKTAAHAVNAAGSNATILFKAGETFDIEETIAIKGRNIVLQTWDGRGAQIPAAGVHATEKSAPATIRKIEGKGSSMFSIDTKTQDVFVQGLIFDSIWPLDSKYGEKKVPARAFTVGGKNFAIRDCTFKNLSDGINTEKEPQGALVQDNLFTNEMRAYGIWGEGADHVYLGNTMKHSRQEHLIRTSGHGVDRLLISHNELSRPNNKKGSIELRRGSFFTIDSNHIVGGTLRIGPQEQDQKKVPDWAKMKCTFGVVIDNRVENVFVNIRLGTEHVLLRNNQIAYNDGEAILVECIKENYDQVRKVIDLRIDHNTVLNTSTKGKFLKIDGRSQGTVLTSNLYIAPKLKCETIQSAAVDVRDEDLGGFDTISDNIWPQVAGPIFQVNQKPVANANWSKQPQVKGDRCLNLPLDKSGNPPREARAGAMIAPADRPRNAGASAR